MNTYTINLIAEASVCPFTKRQLPALAETLTIEAADLDSARRLVPVRMTIRPRGQLLRLFCDGVELFGNF